MVELVRHHPTKGAATDMFEPKATASHLNSTIHALAIQPPSERLSAMPQIATAVAAMELYRNLGDEVIRRRGLPALQ